VSGVASDLLSRPLAEVARLVKSRAVSPVELTRESLAQIDRYDSRLRAFISRYDEPAMRAARNAEAEVGRGEYRGPLHGIPIGLKDNIFLGGRVTTMGSKIHRDHVPDDDAGVVTKLAAAGAIVLGKTNMHEYALGVTTDNPHFGTCRNPWDLNRTPGGSSGGSAAAVASEMVFAALGTDTSGSIRIPAAACGLVGMKPTYGRVGKSGVFPEAWTLDHVGILTRSVADAAIMLDAITGHDLGDPASLKIAGTRCTDGLATDIRGLVIGVEEDYFFADVVDDVARIVRAAIDALRDLGATIKPIKLPSLRHCVWALTIIDSAETTTVHQSMLERRPEDYGDDVRLLLECGTLPTAVDYLQAQQLRRRIKEEIAEVFTKIDVMAAPTLPIRTPAIGETTSLINGSSTDTVEALMRLVGPGNLVGLPSMSVPCGILDGMPVGLELVGSPLGEQRVLNVGAAFEAIDPLHGLHAVAYLDPADLQEGLRS
jgi:aspartyl-tRNA(Asn)/glutamyl-tRNA(Gln) amidotransferase subunit A